MNQKVLMAGLAIFAMFFGSGNIVFPLLLGREAGNLWPWALAGFFLTAIVVPALGLIGMVLCKGNTTVFFQPLGKRLGFIIQLILLSLLGPFGVVPRCISVSLGATQSVFPEIDTHVFIIVFTIVIGLFTLKQEKVISLIAKYLTPIKITSLLFLIIIGSLFAPSLAGIMNSSSPQHLAASGILSGYQTMDLIAGLFFASAIMGYLGSSSQQNPRSWLIEGLLACAVGASLLTLMYAGFMHLGAQFSGSLGDLPPEKLLPTIAHLAFGQSANVVFGGVIVISCMTTAVALTSCWLDFWTKAGIPRNPLLLTTLIITAGVALMGFAKIVAFLSPLLEIIYPGLIGLTLLILFKNLRGKKPIVSDAGSATTKLSTEHVQAARNS